MPASPTRACTGGSSRPSHRRGRSTCRASAADRPSRTSSTTAPSCATSFPTSRSRSSARRSGGRIALELALESPDRVAALVLVGSGLDGHEWSKEVRAFGAEEDAALERGDFDATVDANVRLWLADDVDAEVRALVAEMQRTAFERQVGHEVRSVPLEPPASTRLGEIGVPTLVVTGEEDVPDIHEIADKLATEVAGAERATIAGSGHLPSLERPDAFDEVVLAFLAQHGI